jgi:hypothetical protein
MNPKSKNRNHTYVVASPEPETLTRPHSLKAQISTSKTDAVFSPNTFCVNAAIAAKTAAGIAPMVFIRKKMADEAETSNLHRDSGQ